ncbi:LAME_0A01552g1_1 [Lachancea meyersii CBS 8951]|uniref:LAME_0A01552g1_1 n=1 Tax=Lachancea meyersii CBS 8951 TaxID=1266667 RepID=A0A1G4ILU6_9SACH|nr:LAME_0A01552g1_1 [Lachancea meyersii CBS 8951]
MESRIRELEDHHARVYRELLEVLDKLYLAKSEMSVQDESALMIRRQLQASMMMTAPITTSMTNEGELNSRLEKLMRENYDMDGKLARHQNEKLRLVKEIYSGQKEYKELVGRIRPVASELRNRAETERKVVSQEKVVDGDENKESDKNNETNGINENEVLKELIVGLIYQSGYQGTNETIENWLRYLEKES